MTPTVTLSPEGLVKGLPLLPPHPEVAVRYIRGILGMTLWSKQEQIVRSVFGPHRKTAVRSCHAAGKTHTAAGIVLAWLFTGPYRIAVTTAPTGRQVRELLWKEIRKAYKASSKRWGKPIGGYMPPRAPELRVDEDWLAIGFASDDDVNVQGWHSPGGVLVVLDEAPGVSPDIWAALNGVLTGKWDRLLAIGNPTEPSGPFHDLFSDPAVSRLSISAYDVPNVQHGSSLIPGLVTREWVESMEREWGRESPMFASRVLGEFPDVADDVLVPRSWVLAANERWRAREADPLGWDGRGDLGLDVARYGEDSTVASEVYPGRGVRRLHKRTKQDTVQTVAWASGIVAANPSLGSVRADADGLGAGVYDALAHKPPRKDVQVVEMRGGMTPSDPEHFINRRSEWLWNVRQQLDPSGPSPLSLPPDERLREQMTSLRWRLDSRGRIAVESKDDLRGRGLGSPDELDSIAYGLAVVRSVVVPTVSPSLLSALRRADDGWH